ncbi:MAG: sulfite exporter TauE/SafE family protein [Desulfobacterales bacterium]|nr:MAG: sulfite exporter TauE/SafE family protein [Desulfobacterales bacterium]
MIELTLFSMFMLGLLGTGHCIGMCGPLIIGFPGRTGKLSAHLFYHLGRIVTYVVIGAAMGGIGAGLAGVAALTGGDYLAWVARIQVGFSMLAALFLMIFGLARLDIIREPGWMAVVSPDKLPGYGKIVTSAASNQGRVKLFLVGLMMGFLPCGLSFAAFSRALPAGGPFSGAILVFAFALGTIPGLLLLGTGASGLARRYQKQSDILAGLLMIYMAAELALKALGNIG